MWGALQRFGLKQKIIVAILGAGALPLLLGMLFAYSQSTTELERVIGGSFEALAGETARSIDLVLAGEVARRSRIAANDAIVQALVSRNSGETRQAAGALDVLRRFARTQGLDGGSGDASALRALYVTDASGAVWLAVGPPRYPDSRAAGRPAQAELKDDGQERAAIGPLAFDDALNAYVFTVSVPILDARHEHVIGALHSVYDANAFFKPSIHPVRFGKSGHVMLIDSNGTVIICPILPTGVRVSDPSLIHRVTAEHAGWVKAEGDGHGSRATSIIGYSPLAETSRLTHAATGLMWHSFAWQASEEIFGPTRSLLGWIAAAGVLAIGLLASLGAYAAHRIVEPIRRLRDGAARIGRGEMTEPMDIHTGDEIEELATEFNQMNRRLHRAFSGLEEQVASKTAEVRYLKEYNEKVLNSLPDVVVILKENSIVEYVNAAAARELSVVPERTIGQPLFEALPVDPVVRRQIQKELDLAVAGQSPRWWQPTSGTARRDPLAPVPSDGPPREFRIADRIYRYRIFGLAAGTDSTRLGLVLRDVTGEHQLQDQLIQADKLAGLGTLTAGIAHEINNPLFVVMGLAETLEAEPDLNKTTDTARDIVKYAKHMASVIKNFSRYTTPNATEPLAPVDLNRTVADAVSMAQLADGTATIEVESSYQPLPPVMARPEELQQVFLNIIVNAIQAMKGHGRLRVETDSADGWVQVRITDNGPGIPKTFVGKIFDPFFTTKEPGKGTGLGLNIVYQIVTKYGGTISVSSEEGHGARFTVGFPAMVPVV